MKDRRQRLFIFTRLVFLMYNMHIVIYLYFNDYVGYKGLKLIDDHNDI